MTIEIKMLTLGAVATNCYVVGDTESKQAIVIDPVDHAGIILKAVENAEWTIKLIVATHAHFDHILASAALKESTDAPFYIHKDSLPLLESLPQQGMMFFGKRFPEAATVDRWLTTDSETLSVGAIRLETLYTPGHAPGHIAFHMPEHNVVFAGDCLFEGSIGRTDLPGGDYARLMMSIFDVLLPLGDETIVLSGHGGQTTIGNERRRNPWLLEYAATLS
jgi:hydroxyacylglutathione hydrolase